MSFNKHKGSLKYAPSKYFRKLKRVAYVPSGEVKALAIFLHGYGECLEPYYEQLFQTLSKNGVLCFGHDHTGHGESEGERVQVSDLEEYIQPVVDHYLIYKEKYPGIKLFLIGHSLGGFLALQTALRDQKTEENNISGLVLAGPLIALDPSLVSPFKKFMARMMSKLMPNFTMGGIVRNTVTSDPYWQKVKQEDKNHWTGGFKARHSYILLKSLRNFDESLKMVNIPFLVIHGEQDRVCDLAGSRKLMENAQSNDKTLKILPDCLHNPYLEVEEIRSKAIQETLDWILDRAF